MCTCICMFTCIRTRICICIRTCIFMFICIRIRICMHMYMYMYMCTSFHVYVYICVEMLQQRAGPTWCAHQRLKSRIFESWAATAARTRRNRRLCQQQFKICDRTMTQRTLRVWSKQGKVSILATREPLRKEAASKEEEEEV